MAGPCRLCGEHRELQESHVIPAFVYKWLKETSATGFMRFGENPNKRVQDGYKEYWLCRPCEERLNVWETLFASKVFHPLTDGAAQQRIRHDAWMIKFCTSLSWRALLKFRDEGLDHLSSSQLAAVDKALNVWSKVLLDNVPHPGRHEQHLLVLDTISESSSALPANINRYILRTVAMDVIRSDSTTFVFVKLSKFIILGFIDVHYPRQWVGTKVCAGKGTINLDGFTLPIQFKDYLVDKANRYGHIASSISEVQRAKIKKTVSENLDRVARSATFKAMEDDVELSGRAAFEAHKPGPNRGGKAR